MSLWRRAPFQMDINADLGEGYGNDLAILDIVSSANIACGGHAGDEVTMQRTIEHAMARGVAIGAHPGYPDREGFGRRYLPMPSSSIREFVTSQTQLLIAIAAQAGARVEYVKPHGALGNLAAKDPEVAEAIAQAVLALDPNLAMLAMAGSALETVSARLGIRVCSEIYADRAYSNDGALVPRSETGAVIDDEVFAVARLRSFLRTGLMTTQIGSEIPLSAGSICVHGDNEHAITFAREVRSLLGAEGITVAPFRAAAG